MDVYEGIMQGLNEAIAYNEGNVKARTKTMSIEPVPDFKAASNSFCVFTTTVFFALLSFFANGIVCRVYGRIYKNGGSLGGWA